MNIARLIGFPKIEDFWDESVARAHDVHKETMKNRVFFIESEAMKAADTISVFRCWKTDKSEE